VNSGRERLIKEEQKQMRWLRLQVDFTLAVIRQEPRLDLEQARGLVGQLRRKVVARFPGKEATFDMVLLPRFDRAIKERFGEGFERLIQ
jgi:hypothetical protein